MFNTSVSCQHLINLRKLSRDYEQYYIGDKDEEKRKDGRGRNHWTGPKSLESYEGRFLRDTMHGLGDYFWRFRGPENAFITYEGQFYCNQIHGYGTMSYPNGKTFSGLFLNNCRWGPGVECHANLHDNVGLWRGTQLVRLVWQPAAPNVVPDLMSINTGRSIVESHRIILTTRVEIIGEVNNALELLKQYGADPVVAVNRWSKMYPNHSTDVNSPLCHVDFFNHDFYEGKIHTLHEIDNISQDVINNEEIDTYYAWNNNSTIVDMMKHCYKHDKQRNTSILDLKSILSGPRTQFKSAGPHELQCRTLLMACYMGCITEVTKLINQNNIHPDVCDGQGNSALMYAVCGNQPEIINFLVEAGAKVDFCNDSCCTPLAIALMRYTCAQNDIAPNEMLYALLPPPVTPVPPLSEHKVLEWNLVRNQLSTSTGGTVMRTPSKTARNMSSKKIKSLVSLKDQSTSKRKAESLFQILESDHESFSEEQELYNDITHEYCIRVTDNFTLPNVTTNTPYLFVVVDMIKEMEANDEDNQKKQSEKNPKKVLSKTIKETLKTSKEVLYDSNEKDKQSINSEDKPKVEMLSKITSTILQLLSGGADPKYVRCPHSALLIAVTSNCPTVVRHLVYNGANANETYPQFFDYSCLDVVVSRPFTQSNLEIIKVLLENGADASHRLVYKQETKDATNPYVMIPGPTLLHVVLGKKIENSNEEDIRRQYIGLLLEHNCNAATLFKGRSPTDVAMNKSLELFNIFIEHPKSDLNAVINDTNQSILVKFFSISCFRSYAVADRLSTLTNLLLFGADPLIKCQNGEDSYQNIFVFTKQTLNEMENSNSKATNQPTGKSDLKGKKSDKPKKDEKLSNKSMGKMSADEVEDYKQAIDLMTDCARLIYIRWLQTKLLRELVVVIKKYRHRHWNIIMKGLHSDVCGLWLTPLRCLEIWDILTKSKKKLYNDKRVLRHLLCIVIFMSWKNYGNKNTRKISAIVLTDSLKNIIDNDVTRLLRQHSSRTKQTIEYDMESFNISYIKPELVVDGKKFSVCFECIQPLSENKIVCNWCGLVSFCSLECIKMNVNRGDCHPCSDFLRSIYFPISEEDVKIDPSKSENIAGNKK